MTNDNSIAFTTTDSIDAVCQRLPDVAQRHKFGILGMHDLRQKLLSKGVTFDRECRVYEVCNPQQAKRVLDGATAISTALPCRISVYEENGHTTLATIKPTKLLLLFDAAGAEPIAQEAEDTMTQIIRETAGHA